MKKFSLRRLCSIIARIVFTLLFALVVSIVIIQDDVWLRKRVGAKINQLMGSWYGCTFESELVVFDPLNGRIELRALVALPQQPEAHEAWMWHAQRGGVHWSWANLLLGKKCGVTCFMEDLTCSSTLVRKGNQPTFAIEQHCALLVAPPEIDIPFDIQAFVARRATVKVYEVKNGLHDATCYAAHLLADVDLACSPDGIKIAGAAEQVALLRGVDVMTSLRDGRCSCDVPYAPTAVVHGSCEATCMVSALPAGFNQYRLHGIIEGDAAHISVAHATQNLYGTCQLKKGTNPCGVITMPFVGDRSLDGFWSYDVVQQCATVTCAQVPVPGFTDDVGRLQLRITADQIAATATLDKYFCNIVAGLAPQPYLKKCELRCEDKLMLAAKGDAQQFSGRVCQAAWQEFAHKFGVQVQGEGEIAYVGTVTPTGAQVTVAMQDGNVRFPQTYSVINGLGATVAVDLPAKTVTVSNGTLNFYKGSLSCSQAKFVYDSAGNVTYGHIPCLMNSCLLGWKKELFAQVSGSCMVTVVPQATSQLAGTLFLDQSHVRGNILSADFQQEFFDAAMSLLGKQADAAGAQAAPWVCDVTYATRAPLEIKTPFLEGAVAFHGHVGGRLDQPHVTGSFEFVRGTLAFPYKPLFITKGSVVVQPEALDDPQIYLVARNYIKKYDVEMVITGSARNPTITFSSSPQLEQAQIITLLLGGAEDGSLYFLMPQAITTTLDSLLFGSAESTSRVQKYLATLFKPFKQVSITPRLTDQQGRGGMRGSLEIEVNDRLRGIIEQNISLTEDTTYEIEYDISDDSSVRFLRDERGDFNIEGEMRWKF